MSIAGRTAIKEIQRSDIFPKLLLFQIKLIQWNIPMSVKDLKSSLFFFLEFLLVGVKFGNQSTPSSCVFYRSPAFVSDEDEEVPIGSSLAVELRLVRFDRKELASLDFCFQDGIVILLEQLQELIKVAPFHLVVVRNRIRFACCLAGESCAADQEDE